MDKKRTVVVTGLGLVTPFGVGVDVTWKALMKGQSGIGPITYFDATDFACQIAGEVPGADMPNGFNANDYLDSKEQKKMGRFIQLGMAASHEAIKQAGLDNVTDVEAQNRIAVVLGSGVGGLPEVEAAYETLKSRGPRRVSPFFIPSMLVNLLPGQVSMKYGFKGPNSSVVTACATSTHAIGVAKRMIEDGEADIVISGGAEACICPSAVAGFSSAKALSTAYNDTPEKACRPFDEGRDGFVMSEGAGVLVVESLESAEKRGVQILAVLSGFGQTGDAYHMTSPHPEGDGGKRATEAALADAGMDASEVTYVNAHATSTPMGDVIESKTIESIFGPDILVSATKSMTGHSLGATGAWEAAFCVLAIQHNMLPPTINLENKSDGCDLDYIADKARSIEVTAALSNSFGFGGTNASLLFKKL
ncbi:MAG: 3-oxoacyl-[acyl-carrier-protein] synthase II [Alphaproteobacteria bacterium]|jgi:3-oxoacyl-[acyl-carrier-protein] synthase II